MRPNHSGAEKDNSLLFRENFYKIGPIMSRIKNLRWRPESGHMKTERLGSESSLDEMMQSIKGQ